MDGKVERDAADELLVEGEVVVNGGFTDADDFHLGLLSITTGLARYSSGKDFATNDTNGHEFLFLIYDSPEKTKILSSSRQERQENQKGIKDYSNLSFSNLIFF